MLLWLIAACTPPPNLGASEAFRVREGSFFSGTLPEDPRATTPSVIYAAGVSYVLTQGQGNIPFSGLASTDAYAVAVAFADSSDGYWVVPVDGPDVTQEGRLLFDLTLDFSREVAYGPQQLIFVAINAEGQPGPRYETTLCVLPDYADRNFASCDPEIPPQNTVLSLSWDNQADLDLVVIAPNGKVVSPLSPTTALETDPEGAVVGELSRNSNGNCVIDGFRLESLIFAEEPPAGSYAIYANLRAHCGAGASHFALNLYRGIPHEEGSFEVEQQALLTGVLLPTQATGAGSLGSHLLTLSLP